jgi:chromate transporter
MREVFAAFLKLGLTSFGGPVAHLGYFQQEFVVRRKWLDNSAFADLVALCQFLPGPSSSQVGIALGLSRAGLGGALAAWVAFTLPSALLLIVFAAGLDSFGTVLGAGGVHGLKVAAVAVVAVAIFSMARALPADRLRGLLVAGATAIALTLPSAWGQIGAIALAAVVGMACCRDEVSDTLVHLPVSVSRRAGAVALTLFFALLVVLPLLAAALSNHVLTLFATFYRVGSLVFGGGHVVLPLLQAEVVAPGWVGNDVFLAGYGAAQAIPGPLFSFAAYLGMVMTPPPNGWAGAVLCLVAIYLPSLLLVIGVLPFWDGLRRSAWTQAALRGINAAVVGLLIAAFYQSMWTVAILGSADFALALTAALLLVPGQAPPWLVVVVCALAGAALW